jgi:methylthioribose-1-phosphate isomerase
VAGELAATRPTAVNLRWALERVLAAPAGQREAEALRIHAEQIAADGRMGGHGAAFVAELITPGSTLLTHCNTGALATGGSGTALGVIIAAHRAGNVARVLVDETRPLLQGARLTAWELEAAGVPYEVIVDAAAAGIIAAGEVDTVLVGADRIAANADVANKVGTYGLALAAQTHDVPFCVVAPVSTIDPATATGASIVIEERDPTEVRAFRGAGVTPSAARSRNPAFDVTPASLVTAIITERGVLRPPFDAAIAWCLAESAQPVAVAP